MKKKKRSFSSTYIALGIFFLLLLLVFFLERPRSENEVRPNVPIFSTSDVAQIELKKGTENTVFLNENGVWMVKMATAVVPYPANNDAVEMLLNTIPDLSSGKLASKNSEKHASLGVDETSGIVVTFSSADQKILLRFIVGNQGPTFNSSYFRIDASNETFLLQDNLRSTFDKAEWRDTTIVAVKKEDIRALTIRSGDAKTLRLSKDGEVWKLLEPEEFEVDVNAIDPLLSSLSSLHGLNFVDDETALSGMDLETSLKVLKVWIQDTSESGITLYFIEGEEGLDQGKIYAKRADKSEIFSVSASTRDVFKLEVGELKKA